MVDPLLPGFSMALGFSSASGPKGVRDEYWEKTPDDSARHILENSRMAPTRPKDAGVQHH